MDNSVNQEKTKVIKLQAHITMYLRVPQEEKPTNTPSVIIDDAIKWYINRKTASPGFDVELSEISTKDFEHEFFSPQKMQEFIDNDTYNASRALYNIEWSDEPRPDEPRVLFFND